MYLSVWRRMSEQYLVNVTRYNPNLIDTCGIVVQTLYNAHKEKILALITNLRSTLDAFWLQMTNKETWRMKIMPEQADVIVLLNAHVAKAVQICQQIFDQTGNFIETVKRAACSHSSMRRDVRDVTKECRKNEQGEQTEAPNTMKQWYRRIWRNVRKRMRKQFDKSCEQHLANFDPDELSFFVGAFPSAEQEFNHYVDVFSLLRKEEIEKITTKTQQLHDKDKQ